MGAQNVAKVFMHWRRRLTHSEMCLLLFMSNTALDTDKPPVYFGGWETLAEALGLDPVKNPVSAKRITLRTLAKLRAEDLQVITSSGDAKPGMTADYALNLDPSKVHVPAGREKVVRNGKEQLRTVWKPRKRVTPTVTHSNNQDPATGDSGGHPMGDSYGRPLGDSGGHPMGDSQGSERVTPTVTPRNNLGTKRGIHQEPMEEYSCPPKVTTVGPVDNFSINDENPDDRWTPQCGWGSPFDEQPPF